MDAPARGASPAEWWWGQQVTVVAGTAGCRDADWRSRCGRWGRQATTARTAGGEDGGLEETSRLGGSLGG
ncbi:hypothetical protein E2562_033776 [Oryza meyeriana var. granulata]|uniref:Uncharacterized protein n=1 Tax=Oryza meyeriana var. granulata TaxID=110450 RepID=A0A6G1C0M8_9ORYZ|nr:hypothetical protein E2562_033776 [Oryza meyeriana var. granulata]